MIHFPASAKTYKSLLTVCAMVSVASLTGCGLGKSGSAVSTPVSVAGSTIRGKVYGGQQPVAGSTIQIYAVGTTGYGSAATALIANSITTDSGGNFSVDPGTAANQYNCPSANTPVYIVATGGNSGYTTNANIALMIGLGACGNVANLPTVNINEVSTVASVYALAPFMTGPTTAYTKVGSSATNSTGLLNAMADIPTLANIGTGVPAAGLTAPYTSNVVSGATIPVPAIDTLADILAACVNTNGVGGTSTNCATLFGAANEGGTPTDTITALLNIAKNPATNVATLYGLAGSTPPFLPTLSTQPNDFTLAATFSGSISTPSALASDAAGNIWVTNAGNNTVAQLAHTGAVSQTVATAAGSFNNPSAIAIGNDNTVWITNQGNNTVSRITTAGAAYTGSPYSGGGITAPRSISLDANGTAWVANTASVSTILNGGTVTNYTPAGATSPLAIAVNPH